MDTLFKSSSNFASLSLKDLIDARELFHYHLMNKKNVVATALGLYRIRKTDPWPSASHPTEHKVSNKRKPRRTLFNSEIRSYSWPCIYVFVSQWREEVRLAEDDPSDIVPKGLYLPDGRVVPVCVIEARQQGYASDLRLDLNQRFPRNMLGPGVPILNEECQGVTRFATAGCLVRDGERYYVLTNRHAVGAAGTPIKAVLSTRHPEIGVSADKGMDREDFHKIYPHFTSASQYSLMDVGLIDLDDITQWKTDFVAISPVMPVLDLYDNSFSLKLIGQKVVGNSAVSGRLRGEIHGLFYRFKALGGSEYISDFLIGPETCGPATKGVKEPDLKNVSLGVHHGDSGTVLLIEHQDDSQEGDGHKNSSKNSDKNGGGKDKRTSYYPFALLWGKEEFIEGGKRTTQPFALATSLSTTLDQLNLDLVRDLNLDQEYIWGWVGHYVIGGVLPFAVKLLKSAPLKKFLDTNLALLTVSPDDALGNDPRVIDKGASDPSHVNFVALSDVPDNVWKSNVNFYQVEGDDGKKHRVAGPGSRGQNDNPNHFADMDLPYKEYDTFLEFNLADLDKNLNPADWRDYYDSVKPKYDAWSKAIGKTPQPYSHWGALPFRVWQLFNAMTKAVQNKKQDELLCAGGVLIHYVGDACQPLHTSYLSQGNPDRLVDRPKAGGKKLEADGVHSGYEDDMVSYGYLSQNLSKKLDAEIKRQEHDPKEKIANIDSGLAAAKAIIRLIAATHKTIAPRDIVNKWVELKGTAKSERNQAMWDEFGDPTVECMARGTRYLAKIWLGAWGKDGDKKIGSGTLQKPAAIMKLYNSAKFVPSVRLDKYKPILK